VIKEHSKSVISCPVHPSQDYVATISSDGMWAMTDLAVGETAFTSSAGATTQCAAFHPDGLLVGLGCSDGIVRIWDFFQDAAAADLSIGKKGVSVTSLSFSNNGYYLAATGAEKVFLFDLRKQKVFNTFDLAASATSCCFDNSGFYLAAGDEKGAITTYYAKSKPFKKLATIHEQADAITGLKFGPNASCLAAASLDRTLTVYSI